MGGSFLENVMMGIYKITNTITGEEYIGSSNNTAKRMKQHKYHLLKNKHHNVKLQRSWNKYGSSVFMFEHILDFEGTRENLIKLEEYTILQSNKKLFNIITENLQSPAMNTQVADKISNTLTGRQLSDSHKKNIGIAHSGKQLTENNLQKLKDAVVQYWSSDETKTYRSYKLKEMWKTSEHREKMLNNRSERIITDITRQKISDKLTGINRSEETRKKISNSKRGVPTKPMSEETKRKISETKLKKKSIDKVDM